MALQHLRSGTAHKRPIPTVMSAGQIAINTNEASPGLFFKDSNGDLVKVGPVHIGTTAPNSSPDSVAATALVTGTVYQILTVGTSDFTLVGASANTVGTIFTATGTTTGTGTVSGQQGVEKGEQWLDTTGGAYDLKIYDGTSWRSQAGEFVNVTGDTMTGALLLDNAASVSAPDLSFDGDANTGIYSPGADQFGVATGGTSRLVIDSSGNVGIGNASPGYKCDIDVTGSALRLNSTTSQALLVISSDDAANAKIEFGDESDNDRGAIIYDNPNNALIFHANADERLRITSDGKVGIGTSSPGATLQVSGDALFAGGFDSSSTTTNGLKIDSNGAIFNQRTNTISTLFGGYYQNSQTVKITADGSATFAGNVGIGTTSPGYKLSVNGDAHISTGLGINTTPSTGRTLEIDSFSSAGIRIINSSAASGAYLNFWDSKTGGANQNYLGCEGNNLVYKPNNVEKARIDSSGRLLVGTSSARTNYPNSIGTGPRFQLEGTDADGGTLSIFRNSTSATASAYLALGRSKGSALNSNTVVASGDRLARVLFNGTDGTDVVSAAAIEAYVDGTPGTGDMPGRLVFSTTADGASSPTERVRITDSGETFTFAATNGWNFRTGSSANTSNTILQGAYGATSTLSGTTSIFIYSNGDIKNTNNSYGGISDIKLKENIVDANSQWDDIKDLRVRNYNFIEGQTHTQIGVVAQEVETVSPGLVTESPDRDEDGNDLGTVTKSVNYSVLYMKAVKALQEAMERIETLEANNADLLARVSALEAN